MRNQASGAFRAARVGMERGDEEMNWACKSTKAEDIQALPIREDCWVARTKGIERL
jgi:hypothetical protein